MKPSDLANVGKGTILYCRLLKKNIVVERTEYIVSCNRCLIWGRPLDGKQSHHLFKYDVGMLELIPEETVEVESKVVEQ